MKLKIAILEDNAGRRAAMQRWLNDRLYMYEHIFFDDAEAMIGWLKVHLTETLAISLDHDLELIPNGDGTFRDPATGRAVAEYLARQSAHVPVVIHSSNQPAATGMQQLLVDQGWLVQRVHPYEGTAWIDEAWWPAFRGAIVSPQTNLRSESPQCTIAAQP